MAYQATILNVMIASPSDVAEERQLVRDAIYEWNAIHSKQFGIMLNPIGWEHNVAPQMGSRPQEIINKSILNESDILIGIFWTRLGSPTGEYVSGTVEEISKHCEKNKLASIYISERPYPSNIDLQQLQLLKNQTQIWLKEGLLEFYDDHASFKQKIKDHLSLQIQNNEYIHSLKTNYDSSSLSPHLSIPKEAKDLVAHATKGNGCILHLRYLDGDTEFSTDNFSFKSDNAREVAAWRSSLNFLIENKFVTDLTNKGEIFELTKAGWDLSDSL